jgi:hypothetical protein
LITVKRLQSLQNATSLRVGTGLAAPRRGSTGEEDADCVTPSTGGAVEALSQNDMLRVSPAFPPQVQAPPRPHHLAAFGPTAPLDEVVRAHVAAAIQAYGGNRAAAARALGVGRNTLWRWIKGGRGACNRTGATDRKVML